MDPRVVTTLAVKLEDFGFRKFLDLYAWQLIPKLERMTALSNALNLSQTLQLDLLAAMPEVRANAVLNLVKSEKTAEQFLVALRDTGHSAALEIICQYLLPSEKMPGADLEETEASPVPVAQSTNLPELTTERITETVYKYVRRNTLGKLLQKAGPDFCRRVHDNQVEQLVMWMNSLSERTMITEYQQQCIRSKGTPYDKASYLMDILRTKSASSENLRNSGFCFEAETTRVLLDALSKAELHHITQTLYDVSVKDN